MGSPSPSSSQDLFGDFEEPTTSLHPSNNPVHQQMSPSAETDPGNESSDSNYDWLKPPFTQSTFICDPAPCSSQDSAPVDLQEDSALADEGTILDVDTNASTSSGSRPARTFYRAVRKKAEREKLEARPCQQCERYYLLCGLSEEERRAQIQSVCKHRVLPGGGRRTPEDPR